MRPHKVHQRVYQGGRGKDGHQSDAEFTAENARSDTGHAAKGRSSRVGWSSKGVS